MRLIIILCSVLIPLRAAAGVCPENAVAVGKDKLKGQERIRCACIEGFIPGKSGCSQAFSDAAMARVTAFFAGESKGTVRAWVVDGDKEVDSVLARGVLAEALKTGTGSFATFFFPEGKRLTLGQNTALKFDARLPGYTMNIRELSGIIRIDDAISGKTKAELNKALSFSRAWIQKTMSRRFKVRTSGAAVAVRGTDFLMEGLAEGQFKISILAGSVEVTPDGKDMILLEEGMVLLLGPDGAHIENGRSAGSLEKQWKKTSGVRRLRDKLK